MPTGAELNGLDAGWREGGENLREQSGEDRRGIQGNQFGFDLIKTYMNV